jgi:DNA-binding transcriptional LysR family regulator
MTIAADISVNMLAAFAQVARHSSVSKAAAQMRVSKSVVSKRVAHLESALGATLFSRSTRKIALTPAGELYLEFAQRAVDDSRASLERVRDLNAAASGELGGQMRVTAPVSWGQNVLAKCLPEFLRRHAGVEIELQLTDRMMDLAHEGVDMALRWSSTSARALGAVPVAAVQWVIVASPAYLRRCGTPRLPQDLDKHSCMCYWRERADDAWVLVRADAHVEVFVRSRYHVNNPEAVVNAAVAGLGLALLPAYVCSAQLDSGALRTVLANWTPQTKFGTQITAVSTPERMRLARNRALIEFLQSAVGSDATGAVASADGRRPRTADARAKPKSVNAKPAQRPEP